MGVNMAGCCISDDEACREASRQEIVRRYYESLSRYVRQQADEEELFKIEFLMNQAGITREYRKPVGAALARAEETGSAAAALELADGTMITGKTSSLLGPCSAVLLKSLKHLAGIPCEQHVISPEAIEPLQRLKTQYLGNKNPRLHTDETLIALSISAATSPQAAAAFAQLSRLKDCQLHCSSRLSAVDQSTLKKLGIGVTMEAACTP